MKAEIQTARLDNLALYKIDVQSGPYEYGDRVIVDRGAQRISPPGHFLIWDGVGPLVAHVSAVPNTRKPTAKVNGPTGDYEIDADKLIVIGKVRGVYKKA